jgi:hypothetical protein
MWGLTPIYMDKEVRPHMCEDSVCGNINSLSWVVLFWLVNPVGVLFGVQRKIELSSIYWTQMRRFHLKEETESCLSNVVFK